MKLLFFGLFVVQFLSATIIISEVHYNPLGAESAAPGGKSHEFIELFNISHDTVNLAGMSITDGTHTDQLAPYSAVLTGHSIDIETSLIMPGQKALIVDQDYHQYHPQRPLPITDGTLLLSVNHTSLLGGLTARKGVALLKNDSLVALFSSHPYMRDQALSLDHDFEDNDGYSLHNSSLSNQKSTLTLDKVSPGNTDQSNPHFAFDYTLTPRQQGVLCSLEVVYFDQPTPLVLTQGEKVLTSTISSKIQITLSYKDEPLYLTALELNIKYSLDLSEVWVPPLSLVLTEVNPRGENEWVELCNRAHMSINLENFELLIGENRVSLPSYLIAPGEVVIISENVLSTPVVQFRNHLTLNNYEDSLTLFHTAQLPHSSPTSIDHFYYNSDWFERWPDGHTLSRRNPALPADSSMVVLSKSSVGNVLSMQQLATDNYSLTVTPKVLRPQGSSAQSRAIITLNGVAGTEATLAIYMLDGVKILETTLAVATPFVWDGRSASGQQLPTGPLILIATYHQGTTPKQQRTEMILWND